MSSIENNRARAVADLTEGSTISFEANAWKTRWRDAAITAVTRIDPRFKAVVEAFAKDRRVSHGEGKGFGSGDSLSSSSRSGSTSS